MLAKENGLDMSIYSRIEDLTHLVGPLTEESVLRCLQARFYTQLYQCRIGPIVVTMNSFQHQETGRALTDATSTSPLLKCVVREAVTQYAETGHSQAIVLSGESGSGKTVCGMRLLRHLFDAVGGGSETDAFKHLSATLTVLQSLCSAATVLNPESTRVGMFVENFLSDSAIYRTKIHAYLLDRDRLCNPPRYEKNYHIFYHMLSGLQQEEKAKLHLNGYSVHNLRFLSNGNNNHNEIEYQNRFDAWKTALAVLGIPFSDVMRTFSAVLLLGNIEFVEGAGLDLDVVGNNEIKAVAALLGVSGVALYRGFTTKTRNVRGQVCKSIADVYTANSTRDALAKALYFRTVSAILKRANSLRKPNYNSGLCDSTESNLHQDLKDGQFTRQPSLTLSTSSRLSQAQYDGFISIIDMFGFEMAETNRYEQLCINMCAETMQHFYNTHVFKSTMQALREEGIQVDMEAGYMDNEPIIELLTSKRNGLLSVLDIECSQPKSSPEIYVERAKSNHRINNYFFEPLPKAERSFGIRHFAGRVVYDATNFLHSNRDVLPDDILCVFSKQSCNFGFASHLFSRETKTYSDAGGIAKGSKHRILSNGPQQNRSLEVRGTLSQDFLSKLDNLTKTLVHTKPHFVLCLKSNDRLEMELFDKDVILRQLRSLQVLETLKLMAGGIPHRMRYKLFNQRFGMFLDRKNPYHTGTQQETCKEILDSFLKAMDTSKLPYVSTQWNLGTKHIFFSESTRQHLEAMREEKFNNAAATIQAMWRGYVFRQEWPNRRKQLMSEKTPSNQTPEHRKKQRTKRREGPKKKPDLLSQASKYYSINLDSAPTIPSRRDYSVEGGVRLSYPQFRIMKEDFPALNSKEKFFQGEEVRVVGPSSRKGHLTVEQRQLRLDVPYKLLDIKTIPESMRVDKW